MTQLMLHALRGNLHLKQRGNLSCSQSYTLPEDRSIATRNDTRPKLCRKPTLRATLAVTGNEFPPVLCVTSSTRAVKTQQTSFNNQCTLHSYDTQILRVTCSNHTRSFGYETNR
uniref:Uncharacterized protein n=1 Tax=Rhipicephalus zambeziensis TaxID=60191 RepID=A0A224YEF3_9ACAR